MAEVLNSPISDRQDSTVFSFESERRSRESTALIPYAPPRPITISESGNQNSTSVAEGGIAAQISVDTNESTFEDSIDLDLNEDEHVPMGSGFVFDDNVITELLSDRLGVR